MGLRRIRRKKKGETEREGEKSGVHVRLVCMEAEEKNRKRKLDLDWNKLLSTQPGDEEPPPPLVVIKTEPQPPPSKSDAMGGDDQSKEDFLENLTDHKLEEKIQRQQRNLECLGSKLPDKGKKIRDQLELLEEEKKRRTLSRAKMVCSLTNLLTEKN